MTIKRKVYVDMDGVIADFFLALEKKYEVETLETFRCRKLYIRIKRY
jgi:hypothetical protein